MSKNLEVLNHLINNQSPEDRARENARELAVGFKNGTNRRTYMIDPLYASVLGPSFTVIYNGSPITVYCDGIEREITNEHYQALQTYLNHHRELTRQQTVKSNFNGETIQGDFRKVQL